MLLSQLSGEIIALIARFNGMSVAFLTAFKCGNAALNQKICDNVDFIDLEDQNRASTSRFPKFVSTLRHLRVLRLVRSIPLAPSMVLSSELQKLPSSLTELTLSVNRVDSAFLVVSDSPARTGHDRTSSNTSHADKYWNVATKFPHLLKLALKSCFQTKRDTSFFSAFVSNLPSTIEYLEIDSAHLTTTDNLSSLTSLHTLKVGSIANTFILWPPRLTQLEGSFTFVSEDTSLPFKDLPRTLKTIPTFDIHTPSDLPRLDSLPPATEKLAIYAHWDLPNLNWLPSTLTTLRMSWGLGGGESISAYDLASLPATLTSLKVWNIRSLKAYLDEHEEFESLWPQKLRHLAIKKRNWYRVFQSDDKSARMIKALPTTITDLRAFGTFEAAGLLGDENPFPNLTTLSLKETTLPQRFGPTLKSLKLSAEFGSGLLNCLRTSSLTSLKVSFSTHSDVDLAILFDCLPHCLTALELDFDGRVLWSPESWSLPLSLSSISIGYGIEAPLSVLAHLPPKLRRLNLSLAEAPKPFDILAMPCYHHIRFLELQFEQNNACDDALAAVWPEATLRKYLPHESRPALTNRFSKIKKRSQEYPDPRLVSTLDVK